MSSVNTDGLVDNIPPAQSIKEGWDDHNQHWHEYDALLLTNSSGSPTVVGDVLAVSGQTAVLGDTLGSLQKFVVAAAVIANGQPGEFARSGVITAKMQGAVVAMRYIRKSATARAFEDAGVAVGATATPPSGAHGFTLTAAGGGTALLFLFPEPSVAPGVLDRAVAASVIANTAAETTAYSFTVPGGTLGTDRVLRLRLHLDVVQNTGSDRTLVIRIKLGATTIWSSTTLTLPSSANPYIAVITLVLHAANATDAQQARTELNVTDPVVTEGNSNGPPRYDFLGRHTSIAEDSTVNKDLVVTTEMSVASANYTNTRRLALLEIR